MYKIAIAIGYTLTILSGCTSSNLHQNAMLTILSRIAPIFVGGNFTTNRQENYRLNLPKFEHGCRSARGRSSMVGAAASQAAYEGSIPSLENSTCTNLSRSVCRWFTHDGALLFGRSTRLCRKRSRFHAHPVCDRQSRKRSPAGTRQMWAARSSANATSDEQVVIRLALPGVAPEMRFPKLR